jgi:hypothetical protein
LSRWRERKYSKMKRIRSSRRAQFFAPLPCASGRASSSLTSIGLTQPSRDVGLQANLLVKATFDVGEQTKLGARVGLGLV